MADFRMSEGKQSEIVRGGGRSLDSSTCGTASRKRGRHRAKGVRANSFVSVALSALLFFQSFVCWGEMDLAYALAGDDATSAQVEGQDAEPASGESSEGENSGSDTSGTGRQMADTTLTISPKNQDGENGSAASGDSAQTADGQSAAEQAPLATYTEGDGVDAAAVYGDAAQNRSAAASALEETDAPDQDIPQIADTLFGASPAKRGALFAPAREPNGGPETLEGFTRDGDGTEIVSITARWLT